MPGDWIGHHADRRGSKQADQRQPVKTVQQPASKDNMPEFVGPKRTTGLSRLIVSGVGYQSCLAFIVFRQVSQSTVWISSFGLPVILANALTDTSSNRRMRLPIKAKPSASWCRSRRILDAMRTGRGGQARSSRMPGSPRRRVGLQLEIGYRRVRAIKSQNAVTFSKPVAISRGHRNAAWTVLPYATVQNRSSAASTSLRRACEPGMWRSRRADRFAPLAAAK